MKLKSFCVNGRAVPNHFIIRDEYEEYFTSYDSVVVMKSANGIITLGPDWDYSKTTSKYRSLYLGESTKETRRKLDAKIYRFDPQL